MNKSELELMCRKLQEALGVKQRVYDRLLSDYMKLKDQIGDAEIRLKFTKKYALDRWVDSRLWAELEKEYKEKYK